MFAGPRVFIGHPEGSRSRDGRVFTGVCLSVCFSPHDISKTDAAKITKLDIQMFHNESRRQVGGVA